MTIDTSSDDSYINQLAQITVDVLNKVFDDAISLSELLTAHTIEDEKIFNDTATPMETDMPSNGLTCSYPYQDSEHKPPWARRTHFVDVNTRPSQGAKVKAEICY